MRKLCRIRYVYEKRGATRISCIKLHRVGVISWLMAAGAFVYSIYRNNQSHEQYAEIYRLYENSGAYMRTYKNTFVVNYWSFRINFCYIPRNLLLFDQVNVQLLRYVAIASTAINDIYHCDVYCDVWIWLYVYIVL